MYNNNNGMYTNYEVEGSKEIKESKTSYTSNNMSAEYNMNMMSMPGCVMPIVYECPTERVIHREICHTVPHVCPVNTRIINHHIYRHTYSPCYTCSEENEVCNVTEGCCNNF